MSKIQNDMDAEGKMSLTAAIKAGNVDEVKALLEKGADINKGDAEDAREPLLIAMEEDKLDIFQLLLERKANTNVKDSKGETLLIKSVTHKKPEYFDALIAAGADANIAGPNKMTPIAVAVKNKVYEKAVKLINVTQDLNAFINDYSKETILLAALGESKYGNILALDFSKQLIAKGANVKAVTRYGANALSMMLDTFKLNVEFIQELLNLDVSVDGITYSGKSCLYLACERNHKDFVKTILEKTKLINYVDKQGLSALSVACSRGFVDIVELLLAKGASNNIKDNEGETPLFHACKEGNAALVSLLLAHGANPEIANKKGLKPFDIAQLNNHAEVVTLIQNTVITTEMKEYAKQLEVATDYVAGLEMLSKMIVLGLETLPQPKAELLKNVLVVANNQGYRHDETADNVFRGASLEFELDGKRYPVGYNVFIPPGLDNVHKVMVSAYGGFTSGDEDAISSPDKPFRQAKHLLKAGYPVIELNLPDLLQSLHQTKMDADLQKSVHAAINHFFQTISINPGILSPLLAEKGFAEADFYLFGASFGGRTALRHGQLYPGTFKGYISHDGALGQMEDIPIVGRGRSYEYGEEILPIYHVKDSVDPVLILQNRDDNNVNVKTAITYYQELIKAGKENLARLAFFEKGNPIPEDKELWNKGHFYPETELSRYIGSMIGFMHEGPSAVPALHKFFFLRQKNIADQFIRQGVKKEDRFSAFLWQKFNDNQDHQKMFRQQGNLEQVLWDKEYMPIIQALDEIEFMRNNREYCRKTIGDLADQNKLTDEVIKNAIRRHAPAYREYYKEQNDFKEISIDEICNNPTIIKAFRASLVGINDNSQNNFVAFMLENLYLSNPQLLPSLNNSQVWTAEKLQTASGFFKSSFENSVNESRAKIIQAWKSVTKAVVGKQKKERSTLKKGPTKEAALQPSKLYQWLFLTDTFFVGNQYEHMQAHASLQTMAFPLIEQRMTSLLSDIEKLENDEDIRKLTTIARRLMSESTAFLSSQELEEIRKLDHAYSHHAIHELSWQMLMLDKARDPLSKENIPKALKRQSFISGFIKDSEIKHAASKEHISSIQTLYPDLTMSSILLLIKNVDQGVNVLDKYGQTPLQSALEAGDSALAKLLIQAGANTQSRSLKGHTSLESACKHADLSCIQILLGKGEIVTDLALQNAMQREPEIIRLILSLATPSSLALLSFKHPSIRKLINRVGVENDASIQAIVRDLAIRNGYVDEYDNATQMMNKLTSNELSRAEIQKAVDNGQLDALFAFKNGETLLMLAAKKNDVALMKSLLERGGDVQEKDKRGFTALLHAIECKNIDFAKQLIKDAVGVPAKKVSLDFAKQFLKEKGDFKLTFYNEDEKKNKDRLREDDFKEMLKFAIDAGNLSFAVELIQNVLSLNSTDFFNNHLLDLAIEQGAEEFAMALVNAGANVNTNDNRNNPCLSLAIEKGYRELALFLIRKDAKVNESGEKEPPLILALRKGLDDVVVALIENGANVAVKDSFGVDFLRRCLEKRKFDLVRMALKKGVPLETKDHNNATVLNYVCDKGPFEMAVELIEAGAEINTKDKNGRTPLTSAISWGRFESALVAANKMVERGADVNVVGCAGETPFWAALERGYDKLAMNIIEHGADVEVRNNIRGSKARGYPPLEWCIEANKPQVAVLLIHKGANVFDVNQMGETPLALAAKTGQVEVAVALLEKGANINAQNNIGDTPLAIAIQNEQLDFALALIDKGADVDIKNTFGFTSLQHADENIRERIEKHLANKALQPPEKRSQPLIHSKIERKEEAPSAAPLSLQTDQDPTKKPKLE